VSQAEPEICFGEVLRQGREQERGYWGGDSQPSAPSPPSRRSGERCKLPSGVQGGTPTANAF